MPVSQSWTTATRRSFILARLLRFLLFLSPAVIADMVVAEVLLSRHLFQALDAVVLAGALVEGAARGGVHDVVVAREGWRAHAVRPYRWGQRGRGAQRAPSRIRTARSPARTAHPSRTARTRSRG